jgi:ATP-binding cassette, subfamily C, bacterial
MTLSPWRGLWQLLARTFPKQFVIVLGLTALVGASEGLNLLVLVSLLEAVGISTGNSVGQLTTLARSVMERVGLPPTLVTSLALFVAIACLRALLLRLENTTSFDLVNRIIALIRKRLYTAITNSSWLYFSRTASSHFSFSLTEETDRFGEAVGAFLALLITGGMVVIYLALSLWLSVPLTLMVLICGLALIFLLQPRTKLANKKGQAVSEAYDHLYKTTSEHLAGVKTSKTHGFEQFHITAFLSLSDRVLRAHQDVVNNRASVKFYFEIGSAVTLALSLYISTRLFGLGLDSILLLVFLFSRLIPMLSRLQGGYQELLGSLPAYRNLTTLMTESEAEAEISENGTATPALKESLRVDNIAFRYRPDLPLVIENLSLTLPAFQTTALVGPSGAGKSTLADMLVGLFSPQQGHVMVDGQPLELSALKAWRKKIGYVAQNTFLFNESVRDNLLLAKPDASEAELYEALELAAASDFVRALPNGLDTVVGERGERLSGGERQRLALARALLRRPTLLILDEATSSLDVENEQHIQRALEKLRGQLTILIIAHRLSTISNADIIYVLDKGHLIEQGSWYHLVHQTDGRFRTWCEAQGLVAPNTFAKESLHSNNN